MSIVQFYMAGSGNWRCLFPEKRFYKLYEQLYPHGLQLTAVESQELIERWHEAGFIRLDKGIVIPLIPIFTDQDNETLINWFSSVGHKLIEIIEMRIDDYKTLATKLSKDNHISVDYLLTILICAYTLDKGTLYNLEKGIMGGPPKRGDNGDYFFWGETAIRDLNSFFGVNSYDLPDNLNLSLLWSPVIDWAIKDRKNITIPIFGDDDIKEIQSLCTPVIKNLSIAFSENISELDQYLNRCTFKNCLRGDIFCMLFHISYGLVAERLVKKGLLPAFPNQINDGWGMWIS